MAPSVSEDYAYPMMNVFALQSMILFVVPMDKLTVMDVKLDAHKRRYSMMVSVVHVFHSLVT
jgi:hypothetical protein